MWDSYIRSWGMRLGGRQTGHGSGGYAAVGHVHRPPVCDSGEVGGPMPTSGGMCALDRLQGGSQ